MGFGDAVIVTSIVKRAFAKVGKPLAVGDGSTIHWNEVFENNPKILKKIEPGCFWVREIKGNRPYLDYARTTRDRQFYRESFHVEPGELFFSDVERTRYAAYEHCVYIEPNTKGSYSGNKDWGFDNWQEVVDGLPGVRFVQGAGRRLRGVDQVGTRSFRDACCLLYHADLFVGTDGGLHHAAAALGKRAVVLWGGLAPPAILGYVDHINLCKAEYWCGAQSKCQHCRTALEAITPAMTADAIRSQLTS